MLDLANLLKGRRGPCFGAVMDQWLAAVQPRLKVSSFAAYTRIVNLHLRPALGALPLRSITQDAVNTFLASKRRIYAQATVQGMIYILNMLLEYAQEFGLRRPPRLECPHPGRGSQPPRTLTEREFHILEGALCARLDLTRACVLLCMYTGLRLGEVCGLKWADVDIVQGLLTVRRTVQRVQLSQPDGRRSCLRLDTPKSASACRCIPLPRFLLPALRPFQGPPEQFVLSGRTDRPMEPRTLQKRFKRLLQDAGLPDTNFHTLRHTFATLCVERGMDTKALSKILGHSSVSITLNHYVHPSMHRLRDCMERLSRALRPAQAPLQGASPHAANP